MHLECKFQAMRFNLIYFTLLWAFFCTTEVFGKVKLLESDIRHITKLGNYKVRQERCMFLTRYGPCKKKIVVYGYNIVTNRCSEFLYSGCGGNPNRFTTDSQCRNTCYVVPVRKPVSVPDYYADDDVTEPMPEDEPYDY
ncbi:kunitz-type serine protease inhibitor homolog beta-bungarotoxin B6 chain [Drosophila mauritiana]|uniref:Kunitz-type serine protease inhibitor homolog beta-bungarotoxin B6 chain n=1 Tax=Drosophila mauritiana TaxID=7226 RepID=A0A6P8K9U6_DROMA|nr:kunitz-type serine protease inhibitor homolog beta-bungarotoxin B6 chain [Drosophila mauritiana]